jgi:hypothetical protein
MGPDNLKTILLRLTEKEITLDQAVDYFNVLPYQDLGYAKIDHHRNLRQGFPEVIFCQGKTVSQVTTIFQELVTVNRTVLATRSNRKIYLAVKKYCPEAVFFDAARCLVYGMPQTPLFKGEVLIISAGTADEKVAEEAAICAQAMGNPVKKLFDVGVAGLHRLIDHYDLIHQAKIIIVVAGMEGALPSVVGGLTNRPVIAVPTSIGYGASFGGLAPLLTMLNSCAMGIGVVNIDNGFGAAALATAINRLIE